MKIQLIYDSSTASAPAGFAAAMQYAANQIGALLTNNITVSISVSWNNAVLGEGGADNMPGFAYSSVVAALTSHASSAVAREAAASLPATAPANGSQIYLTDAQALALGLESPVQAAAVEGGVTFGTGGAILDFSTTNPAIPGEIDFVGVAEHELTHALARIGWGDGLAYSLMDLYRFASPGVLQTGAIIGTGSSPPAYFSIDNGATSLAAFATTSDYYDWASSVPADSFDAFAQPDTVNIISSVDETLLAAMGFNVACFCPGTRIATPAGERPIESLAIGDAVITRFAGVRRIKWIGHSDYDGRFIGANPLMLPVTIHPGALGPGVPARALTVSPGHGVALGGMLAPAWRLVNGISVTQPARVGQARYLHLELDAHDLLCSADCWSESYLNETPRGWFQNAAEYDALYPGPEQPQTPCLPRLEEGFPLHALQSHVAMRAGIAAKPEAPGRLRGEINIAGPDYLAGWALNEDQPDVPVSLLVLQGGEIIARLLANGDRADLRAQGLGQGCYGFIYRLPPGLCGPFSVRRLLDGAPLPAAAAQGEPRAA